MNSDPFDPSLNLDLVEDYENTQSYVTTLFETLPKIELASSYNKGTSLIKKLIAQNQQYAKKIIELSQKFTSIYRKDHIFDKKDVQEKIKLIYQIVVDQQIPHSLQIDEMLSLIVKQLKSDSYSMIRAGYQHLQESQGRNSQIQNILANKMVESKIQLRNITQSNIKQSKLPVVNQNLYLEGLNPNGQNLAESVAVSRKQSIMSKNKSAARSTTKKQKNILEQEQVPLKKILKIKAMMEDEEQAIKQMFTKITGMLSELKVSKLNISEQKLSYTRVEDQTNQQNLQQLLQASTSNHKANLHKVSQLLQLAFQDMQKKLTSQLQSQTHFALFTKQIQKRQEVYSYAVSKLLGQLNNLKASLGQHNYQQQQQCLGMVEDLIAVGAKFYQLYPSSNVIKELKVKVQKRELEAKEECNVAVQVNTLKGSNSITAGGKHSSTSAESNRQSAQYQLEMFKFETKLIEVFDKFQKNQLKFKKFIEVKDVHKLLTSIKELIPERNKATLTSSQLQDLTKFESEYRQLVAECQQKEQKLAEEMMKKEKKHEKLIKQLEQKLELTQQQKSKQLFSAKDQVKKLTKKLQNTQQKHKQSQNRNQEAQKIVKLVQQQIELIKKRYRQEQLQFEHKYQQQEQKLALISQETSQKESKLYEISSKHQEQHSEFQAEVSLYKKKIVLLEDRNASLGRENEQFQSRLQAVATSAELSKQNLLEMTELYEKKIKEVDQMIENIEDMKQKLDKKTDKITELQEENEKLHSISSHFQTELQKQLQLINRLKEQAENERKQKQRIEQTGQLNESDIQKLKTQMAKVHSAYIQSEEQLQSLRELYDQLETQANKLEQHNNTLTIQNSQLGNKIQQLTLKAVKHHNLQKNNQQLVDANNAFQLQNAELAAKVKQLQNELYLVKKESKNLKEEDLERSRELRELRQELQRHREEESLIKGKSKIEVETLKMELRKKTEENARIKEMHEEKMEMLATKYKELQKFVSQKELLAKISGNHSTQ